MRVVGDLEVLVDLFYVGDLEALVDLFYFVGISHKLLDKHVCLCVFLANKHVVLIHIRSCWNRDA